MLIITFAYISYLRRADPSGPRFAAPITTRLARFSPWQIIVGSTACLYVLKNIDRLLGMGQPEPLARLYSRQFYRGTWILTALDAGFWTAMGIPLKPLRDLASILFTFYYIIFADQADEKVRKVRATITLDQMRVSWEKSMNPYLRFFTIAERPRIAIRRKVLMKRSPPHDIRSTPIWVYYNGPKGSLAHVRNIVLDFPGGGFVCMPPPCHDERLMQWSKALPGTLILSVDYGKAPEFPYPWGINECFDVYRFLIETKGSRFGIKGVENANELKIILSGDSAGGNFATGVMTKIIQARQEDDDGLRKPDALMLIYPALDFDIRAWMEQSKVGLLKASASTKQIPGIENVIESKEHMRHKSPLSVVPDVKQPRTRKPSWRRLSLPGRTEFGLTPLSQSEVLESQVLAEDQRSDGESDAFDSSSKSAPRAPINTRLAMTSRMCFFNDRILTPDLMRAMSILYVGPNNAPDLVGDYLISPINTPLDILVEFPKTYIVCGEKDPLVDDTVVFAGLLRQAHEQRRRAAAASSAFRMSKSDDEVSRSDKEIVEVRILEGMSHGFLQMLSLVPDAKKAMRYIETKMQSVFEGRAPGVITSSTSQSSLPPDDYEVHGPPEEEEGIVFKAKKGSSQGSSQGPSGASGPISPQESGYVQEGDLMRNRREGIVKGLI